MMFPLFFVLVIGLFVLAGTRIGEAQDNRRARPTRTELSTEERIEALKEQYVNGEMDLIEFERRVESLYEDGTGAQRRSGEPATGAQNSRSATTRSTPERSVRTAERRGRGCRR